MENKPIQSLQLMLQSIGRYHNQPARLLPTGIYCPETASAVTEFQRQHGLPPTGVTDRNTWDAVVQEYEKASIDTDSAESLQIEMPCHACYQKGSKNSYIALVQCMLNEISETLHCVCSTNTNGLLDEATECALSDFQSLCGIPTTGSLDKTTWKHLCLHYPGSVALHRDRKE